MKQITFNPNNEPYYSEDFIKGFKCGAERQFEADKADRLIKESDVLKAIDKRIKELSKHPEADRPQGEWIPCDKELPALMTDVLGTDEHGHIRHVYRATRHGKNRFETVEEGMGINILAWMPLPKPWKGADDE